MPAVQVLGKAFKNMRVGGGYPGKHFESRKSAGTKHYLEIYGADIKTLQSGRLVKVLPL